MKEFFTYQFDDLMVYQTPCLWKVYQNYNYMIAKDSKAIVFDPGELGPILNTIEKNQLEVEAIYLTHHHNDHVGAARSLASRFDCDLFGFDKDQKRLPLLTGTYQAEEVREILGHKASVMHLPGHTLGLCAFYFEDLNLLFSNDLIFSLGCGRVFEGSMEQMYESLNRVRCLPDATVVFASHEYTETNLNFGLTIFPQDPLLRQAATSILAQRQSNLPTVPVLLEFEKTHNPFLRWDDVGIREALELKSAKDWEVFSEIRRLKDLF